MLIKRFLNLGFLNRSVDLAEFQPHLERRMEPDRIDL